MTSKTTTDNTIVLFIGLLSETALYCKGVYFILRLTDNSSQCHHQVSPVAVFDHNKWTSSVDEVCSVVMELEMFKFPL